MSISLCAFVRRSLFDIRQSIVPLQGLFLQNNNNRLPYLCQPQVRGSRVSAKCKRRRTSQPFYHARVLRTLYPEHVTGSNEEFLQEVIEDRYETGSPLVSEPWPRGEWEPKSQRCGLIAKKIGIYPMWKKNGTRVLATLLHVCDNHVVRYVPASEVLENCTHKSDVRLSKRPRGQLVVGADPADPRLFTREYFKMFEQSGVMPKKKLTKFVVTDNAILQPGTPLYATHFRPGEYVDVSGFSIDRGFQGVMVRWHFKGGRATHGNTKNHRRGGAIGHGGSTVLPGKKMPGQMGMEFVTARGLKILRINSQYNCIWVKGPAVPGATGGYVNMYDSGLFQYRYKNPDSHPPFPTHYPAEQPLNQVDWYAEEMHRFPDDTISFQNTA